MPMTERGQLRPEQVAQLLEAVKPHRVKLRDGHSHMEGYDIRAHLTRVFGFEGWDIEAEPAQLIHERELDTGRKKDSGWPIVRYSCAYRQHLTLAVYNPDGLLVKRVVGQAVGKAENQPSFGDAHDLALKDAETQALKRAAMNLGDQFGLGLYNKAAGDGKGGYKASVKVTLVRMPEAPGAGMETPEVGEEGDDARRSTDTPSSEPERSARPDEAPMTTDDWAELEAVMTQLTDAERARVKAERIEKGLSLKAGEATLGTVRWLMARAGELVELREKAAEVGRAQTRDMLESEAIQARRQDAADQGRAPEPQRRSGARLASREERETVAVKLDEMGPLAAEVEQWARDNHHDLANLAATSYQPVMMAMSNIRRAGKLKALQAERPARSGNRGAPVQDWPEPDPDAARRELRRQQWETISETVTQLGEGDTWPIVRNDLTEAGLITADHDGQQVNALFLVAGAEHDEFLANMVTQYQEVLDEFQGRPFDAPSGEAATDIVTGNNTRDDLDDEDRF